MKSIIYNLCLGFLLMGAISACDDDKDKPGPELPGEERTVLAYLIGDNASNDLSRYLLSDFNEMVEGMKGVDATKYNLIVYSETQADVPHLIRLYAKKGKVVADTLRTYTAQNPLEKSVMSDVFSYVFDEFPAKSYGLVFASHGEGWLPSSNPPTRWIGDYRRTYMDITDLRDVLESFPRFDYIFFDACYMQAIEVAYELRGVTDYVISSPTEIPGSGAPYQKTVPQMFTSNAAINIAQSYYEYYGKEDGTIIDADFILDGEPYQWKDGVSVSVLKTSMLEPLADLTKNIFAANVGYKENIDVSSLYYYSWCSQDLTSTYYYYDFDGFINMLTNSDDSYSNWRKAFDNAQVFFKTTKTNRVNRVGNAKYDMSKAEGVYTYVPKDNSTTHKYYQTLGWYNAVAWQGLGW